MTMFLKLTIILVVAGCSPAKHIHPNPYGHTHTVDDHWHETPKPVMLWSGETDDPYGMAKNYGH